MTPCLNLVNSCYQYNRKKINFMNPMPIENKSKWSWVKNWIKLWLAFRNAKNNHTAPVFRRDCPKECLCLAYQAVVSWDRQHTCLLHINLAGLSVHPDSRSDVCGRFMCAPSFDNPWNVIIVTIACIPMPTRYH